MTTVPILQIIDLSSNNTPPYDLTTAKAAGIAGVITKLSEGTGYRNPDFDDPWAQAATLNMWRAAYHFARPDLNSPQAEAAYFLSHLPALASYDAVALDIEVGDGDLSVWALAWLSAVKAALGFAPLLYSDLGFIRQHLTAPGLAAYPLWLADYDSLPASVPPWPYVTLWQQTNKATVAGISGPVDLSVIARDLPGLRVLGKPAPSVQTRPVAVTCALKLLSNHTCVALAQLPVGSVVQVLSGPIHTDDTWVQVIWQGVAGYIPLSKLVPVKP